MKKKFTMIACTIVLSMIINLPAWAGQWFSDGYGWRWLNDNGTVPVNVWQWIDGNNDGVAECYYFSPQGYCYLNGRTPDGYMVNASGAWVVNGIVQTQLISPVQNRFTNNTVSVDLFELEPVNDKHYYKISSAKTTQGQSWTDGHRFLGTSYAEFYTGGKYTTLSFVYAPMLNMSTEYEGTIKVYGDNNTLLWESDTIHYKTGAQNVTVDVSGQQYIKISLSTNRREITILTTSHSESVLLKDTLLQ